MFFNRDIRKLKDAALTRAIIKDAIIKDAICIIFLNQGLLDDLKMQYELLRSGISVTQPELRELRDEIEGRFPGTQKINLDHIT